MAESRDHNQFKLITTERNIRGDVGDDVTLPCHLSPETSAVTMTIRWFRRTECIYLYKNGQVTERSYYEDRLSLITQEMERGNVSLRMKNIKESDSEDYICQVIHGEQKEEVALCLDVIRGDMLVAWRGSEISSSRSMLRDSGGSRWRFLCELIFICLVVY
ncbi:butyrophilin-like protein 1 [Esox lucius]|uniref:butyrophilin-like protein 1 n=1 Tax=Esox lucius TaxID=8010 RepID=UPI0014777038|nr:butyrophilin-like protein 1 [Esox lucius]